jgi:Na+/melibiose symporter-like transporter
MKKNKLTRFFGTIALAVITIGVMLFLGKHSLNFFTMSFQGQDEIYAWLGLLLTSGGAVGWLVIFVGLADTTIRKGTAIIMMVVAAVGEFLTAGFDMYLNTLLAGGDFSFKPDEVKMMATAVAGLGLLTGLALIAYAAGDAIANAFSDDDRDGIPNIVDRKDDRPNR